MQTTDEPLLTTAQMSGFLQLSADRLRTLARQGIGPPAIRVGRDWRYRRSDVEAWLDERSNTKPAA